MSDTKASREGLEVPAASVLHTTLHAWRESDALLLGMADWRASFQARLDHAQQLGLAALCLHGRISWEMVDALRSEVRHSLSGGIGAMEDRISDDQAARNRQMLALADLLEILLPPREP